MGWPYRVQLRRSPRMCSARTGRVAVGLFLSMMSVLGAVVLTSVPVGASTSVPARPAITRPPAGNDGPDALGDHEELVATAVAANGYFTEFGAGVQEDALGRMQRRLVSAGDEIGVVMLAQSEPQIRSFANDILDLVRGKGSKLTTIVVISPTDLAGASRRFNNLDEGLAAALPVFEKDIVGGFVELHTALTGGPLPAGGKEPSKPSSTPWPAIFGGGGLLLAVAAVILALRGGRVRTPTSGAV